MRAIEGGGEPDELTGHAGRQHLPRVGHREALGRRAVLLDVLRAHHLHRGEGDVSARGLAGRNTALCSVRYTPGGVTP